VEGPALMRVPHCAVPSLITLIMLKNKLSKKEEEEEHNCWTPLQELHILKVPKHILRNTVLNKSK
jgi:hypothetical protein